MKTKVKVPVLTIGEETPAGRIYPLESVEAMIRDAEPRIRNRRFIGCSVSDVSPAGVNLESAAFVVVGLSVERDQLMAEIEFLSTAAGKAVAKCHGLPGFSYTTLSRGMVEGNMVVPEELHLDAIVCGYLERQPPLGVDRSVEGLGKVGPAPASPE